MHIRLAGLVGNKCRRKSIATTTRRVKLSAPGFDLNRNTLEATHKGRTGRGRGHHRNDLVWSVRNLTHKWHLIKGTKTEDVNLSI